MNELMSRIGVPIIVTTLTIMIYAIVFDYMMGSATFIYSNSHDFFIPLNAAYVFQGNGFESGSIKSPLGPLYFILSSNSLWLIDLFSTYITTDKIHAISSLQFSLILIILFFSCRFLQTKNRKLPSWLLFILVLICFQPRNFDSIFTILPDWYGIYNFHLWSILLLQAINHFSWRNEELDRKNILQLAVLESIFLLISFNYKISFFIASIMLTAVSITYIKKQQQRILYFFAILTCYFLVTSNVSLLLQFNGNISYHAYLIANMHAAEAKQLPIINTALQIITFFAFLIGCYFATMSVDQKSNIISQKYFSGGRKIQAWFDFYYSAYGFYLIAGLSLLMAALGDYYVPRWPYIVLLTFIVFVSLQSRAGEDTRRNRNSAGYPILFFSSLWLGGLVIAGLLSLKIVADVPDMKFERNEHNIDGPIYISEDKRPIGFFVYRSFATFSEIIASGLFSESSNWKQKLFEYSYRINPDEQPALTQHFAQISSAHYLDDLKQTTNWIKDRNPIVGHRIRIGHVGFANPWPYLTGNLFPDGSLHWAHLGTTLSFERINDLIEPLSNADLVVVPLIEVDDDRHSILKCFFFLWNIEHNSPFKAVDLVGLNLIFARKDGPFSNPDNLNLSPYIDDVKLHCGLAITRANAQLGLK